MSLAFTKEFTVTGSPQMILGKDGNRKELTIFNMSDTDFIFLGFGNENSIFSTTNSMPLAPGETYDASTPPLNAVFLISSGPEVPIVVYYSTTSPAYVKGLLA